MNFARQDFAVAAPSVADLTLGLGKGVYIISRVKEGVS
jgi:hypothetical protein